MTSPWSPSARRARSPAARRARAGRRGGRSSSAPAWGRRRARAAVLAEQRRPSGSRSRRRRRSATSSMRSARRVGGSGATSASPSEPERSEHRARRGAARAGRARPAPAAASAPQRRRRRSPRRGGCRRRPAGRRTARRRRHEANSHVSRTIRSGRQSLVTSASMPGQRGAGVEADEQLADHERARPGRRRRTPAPTRRSGPAARRAPWNAKPARSTMPARRVRRRHQRPRGPRARRRGRTAPAARSARRPDRSRTESAYGRQTAAPPAAIPDDRRGPRRHARACRGARGGARGHGARRRALVARRHGRHRPGPGARRSRASASTAGSRCWATTTTSRCATAPANPSIEHARAAPRRGRAGLDALAQAGRAPRRRVQMWHGGPHNAGARVRRPAQRAGLPGEAARGARAGRPHARRRGVPRRHAAGADQPGEPLDISAGKWLLNPGAVIGTGCWLELDLEARTATWRIAAFDPAPARERPRVEFRL